MANEYQQTDVQGTTHKRGRSITFENPYNAIPSVYVAEERVIDLGDKKITESSGAIIKNIYPELLNTEFPLLNPLNNEPLGPNASYQQLYVMLFSLYWHLAQERDNQIKEIEVAPESI